MKANPHRGIARTRKVYGLVERQAGCLSLSNLSLPSGHLGHLSGPDAQEGVQPLDVLDRAVKCGLRYLGSLAPGLGQSDPGQI